MYENLALLAAFVLVYSLLAGVIERTWLSGPIVFTLFGLLIGPMVFDLHTLEIDRDRRAVRDQPVPGGLEHSRVQRRRIVRRPLDQRQQHTASKPLLETASAHFARLATRLNQQTRRQRQHLATFDNKLIATVLRSQYWHS